MNGDVIKRFKSSTTHWCVICCERVNTLILANFISLNEMQFISMKQHSKDKPLRRLLYTFTYVNPTANKDTKFYIKIKSFMIKPNGVRHSSITFSPLYHHIFTTVPKILPNGVCFIGLLV